MPFITFLTIVVDLSIIAFAALNQTQSLLDPIAEDLKRIKIVLKGTEIAICDLIQMHQDLKNALEKNHDSEMAEEVGRLGGEVLKMTEEVEALRVAVRRMTRELAPDLTPIPSIRVQPPSEDGGSAAEVAQGALYAPAREIGIFEREEYEQETDEDEEEEDTDEDEDDEEGLQMNNATNMEYRVMPANLHLGLRRYGRGRGN